MVHLEGQQVPALLGRLLCPSPQSSEYDWAWMRPPLVQILCEGTASPSWDVMQVICAGKTFWPCLCERPNRAHSAGHKARNSQGCWGPAAGLWPLSSSDCSHQLGRGLLAGGRKGLLPETAAKNTDVTRFISWLLIPSK